MRKAIAAALTMGGVVAGSLMLGAAGMVVGAGIAKADTYGYEGDQSGYAALRREGWRASIAGNRITVNDELLAQFIGTGIGPAGGVDARWVIYRIAGMQPVGVVGSERQP